MTGDQDDGPDVVMQQRWCCLNCSQTFRFGQIRIKAGGLECPKCESGNLHPADGATTELDSYGGDVGTLN